MLGRCKDLALVHNVHTLWGIADTILLSIQMESSFTSLFPPLASDVVIRLSQASQTSVPADTWRDFRELVLTNRDFRTNVPFGTVAIAEGKSVC